MLRAVAAAAVLLALAGCSGPDPRVPAGEPTRDPEPTPTPSTEPQPQPQPGTVPPDWLGTRVLPLRPDGFGEVGPTPPELRHRRFTLPDTLDPLPGRGFASRVDPVPPEVLARSTWQPGCPVSAAELASAYLDRGDRRAGMIGGPGEVVVSAFASIGWAWGGDWRTLKDYQHFSQNGR